MVIRYKLEKIQQLRTYYSFTKSFVHIQDVRY